MFPSSALRVVENTPNRLVIVNPPSYLVGTLFLLVALFLLTATIFGVKNLSLVRRAALCGLLVLPFLLVAVAQLGSGSVAIFDGESRTVTVRTRVMGYPLRSAVVPLADLQRPVVESGRGTRRLVLLLRGGSIVPIGLGHSSQSGQYEAAAAISQFLHQPSQP
jgi:hypothetical protein